MNDIVPFLIRQAEEIATEGHNGWGNTMIMAAEEIERLRARNKRLEEALTSCIIQIEYMHRKFKPTGSGEATIVQARAALED